MEVENKKVDTKKKIKAPEKNSREYCRSALKFSEKKF